MKEVPKSRFKPKSFEYFRQVEQGDSLIVTDKGRPVAKVVPYSYEGDSSIGALRGTIERFIDPTEPVGISDWEVTE